MKIYFNHNLLYIPLAYSVLFGIYLLHPLFLFFLITCVLSLTYYNKFPIIFFEILEDRLIIYKNSNKVELQSSDIKAIKYFFFITKVVTYSKGVYEVDIFLIKYKDKIKIDAKLKELYNNVE